MANWSGTCRSNYFRVKDEPAFLAMLEKFDIELLRKDDMFSFISDNEYGSVPDFWDEDKPEDDPISIIDLIGEHLAENSVCVIQESGAEKARYVTGHATAIAWTGEITSISLNDIYAKAQEEFGGDAQITEAIY